MSPSQTNRLRRLAMLAALLVILLSLASIAQSVYTRITTGQLRLSTASGVSLSVSANGHRATIIGAGSATVRLHPGRYLVAARYSGGLAQKSVQITKGKLTTAVLPASAIMRLPSVENISFKNGGSLVDAGLTSGQLTLLERYFFYFDRSAQVVAIDANSLSRPPHDPNGPNPDFFQLTFSVRVDSAQYHAVASYSDPTTIELQLFAPSGGLMYDSAAQTASE